MKRTLFSTLAVASAALTLAATAAAGTDKTPEPGVPAAAPAAGKAAPASTAQGKAPKKYTVVETTPFTARTGVQTRGTVTCPVGLLPIGGGAVVQSNSTRATVNSSFPLGNEWVADVNNASGADTTFEVSLVCAKPPRGYAVVQSAIVDNPSGAQTTALATCPAGTKPLGGGASSSSSSPFVGINSTFPDGASWRVDENNASASDAGLKSFAICGRLAGYKVVEGPAALTGANTVTPITVTCPSPTVPIGGGAISDTTSVGVNLNTTSVDDENGWTSWVANASGVDFVASPIVVCAGR